MNSLAAAKDHAVEATTHAKDVSVEKAREIACDVNKGVHQNPWPYIAGSAVAGMLLATFWAGVASSIVQQERLCSST